MLKGKSLPRLLALVALLLTAVTVAAQSDPAAPAAARVRVAHLAPFAGSDSANISVELGGNVIASNLAFGDRTNYQNVAGGAGAYEVVVLRDGSPVHSEPVNLPDGDVSLVVVGDNVPEIPLDVYVVDDTMSDPGAGSAAARILHVAPIGTTIDATRVDICSQEGVLFSPTADALRYLRSTADRILPAGDYDLKVTRTVPGTPCAGTVVIDPPPLTLAEGDKTSLYLVGDGPNQPLTVFTFEDGLIGGEQPTESAVHLPVIVSQ